MPDKARTRPEARRPPGGECYHPPPSKRPPKALFFSQIKGLRPSFMRLNSIKLAGFKSFAEPTTFQLPGQLVGVVGPNGCGKSNIMDAVRWVLGESKASELRGESMMDVIFNGSSNRKPVSRASVDLFSTQTG